MFGPVEHVGIAPAVRRAGVRWAGVEAVAIASRGPGPAVGCSLSLNPPETESVPIEIFEQAIDAIEKKLGFEGQPRAIVFHEKEGRRHAHCVWSRIHGRASQAAELRIAEELALFRSTVEWMIEIAPDFFEKALRRSAFETGHFIQGDDDDGK